MSVKNVMPLEKIGRYEINDELGSGAMGVVYRATDPNIGRKVALKTMRLDVHGIEAQEMLQRFKNEARAAGVLNHPNLVTVYDAGEQDGIFYIAMEYIEGVTLHQMLTERRVLPVEQMIEIARNVCAGLDYAHARHIVHRDIKPANIMITPDGTAKIMDFGIAKAGGGLTSTGQVLGTPNYMSPEQVKGKQIDGRSDLFSLGVILYEAITGEKPFAGQNVTTIIYKIVNENPIAPRDLDVTIHPGLSAVITRSLAKLPDDRYQTGAEMMRDLQNYKSIGSESDATTVLPAGGDASGSTRVIPAGVAGTAAGAATGVARASATQVTSPGTQATAARILQTTVSPSATAQRTMMTPAAPKSNRGILIGGLIVLLVALVSSAAYVKHHNKVLADQQAAADRQHQQEMLAAQQQAVQQAVQEVLATEKKAEEQTQPAPTDGSDVSVKHLQPAGKSAQPGKPVQVTAPQTQARTEPVTASPPATTGELQLSSTPDHATVQIDGRTDPGWITPFSLAKLKPGEHTVIFTKDGFIGDKRQVIVVAGKKTPVIVELASANAILQLNSAPQGAAIFVDGKDSGMVTPAQITVEKGNHSIALRKDGFQEAGVVAQLGEGQSFNFAPALKPAGGGANPFGKLKNALTGQNADKGFVVIRSRPAGARLVVNGIETGKITPLRFPIKPGSYHVALKMDGYKPLHRQIQVETGKVIEMDEMLEPQQ